MWINALRLTVAMFVAILLAGCAGRKVLTDAPPGTDTPKTDSVIRPQVLAPGLPGATVKRNRQHQTAEYLLWRVPDVSSSRFSPRKLSPNSMAVHAIDVGQGDAFLIEFECAAALIDAGGEYGSGSNAKENLARYLNWFFSERRPDLNYSLGLVVLSHSHADHVNGVPVVLGQYPDSLELRVDNVVDSGYDYGAGEDEQVLLRDAAAVGYHPISVEEIDWYQGATSSVIDPIGSCGEGRPDPVLRVLWGSWRATGKSPSNPNHHSVVMRIDYGLSSFLFTGDLQTNQEGPGGLDVMLDDYRDDQSIFDVDVLKVSHHGATNGTTAGLLQAVTPCIAMIGVGDPDRRGPGSAFDHGHPRSQTIDLLASQGVGVSGTRSLTHAEVFDGQESEPRSIAMTKAIYGTAWDGSFVIYANANGDFTVQTQREKSKTDVHSCR